MNVQRIISWYGNSDEEFIEELCIDEFLSLDELKQIFTPYKGDDLLYMVYDINKDQKEELIKKIPMEFNFEHFSYYLECYQV